MAGRPVASLIVVRVLTDMLSRPDMYIPLGRRARKVLLMYIISVQTITSKLPDHPAPLLRQCDMSLFRDPELLAIHSHYTFNLRHG